MLKNIFKTAIIIYLVIFIMACIGGLLLKLFPHNLYLFEKWVHLIAIFILILLLLPSIVNFYFKRKTMTDNNKQISTFNIIIGLTMLVVVTASFYFFKTMFVTPVIKFINF